jgi:RsiW-degrading membrane proteinase PrsW (M82 family)
MVQYTLPAAVVPSLLLIWYFHHQDVHPEPQRVVWATFFLGVLTVLPVLAVVAPLMPIVRAAGNPWTRSVGEAFVLAAFPEELFKLAVLLRYVVRQRDFDEPMDGIVYGVVASLGFATLENVIYVSQDSSLALLRALTAVPGHAFTGAIMGFYLGQAYFPPVGSAALVDPVSWRRRLIVRGYLVAVLLHGLYDFPLFASQIVPGAKLVGLVALAVLIVEGTWAHRLVRRLHDAQVADDRRLRAARRGLLIGSETPAPVLADLGGAAVPRLAPEPPRRAGRPFGSWLLLGLGALLATGGGIMTIGLIIGIVTQLGKRNDLVEAALGGLVIGILPLAIGLYLFRRSVRRG